jgi:nitrite reductase/ring-hydroxylating ferredoxin subunit
MSAVSQTVQTPVEKPVIIPIDAYVSPAYARAESDKLWAKVWQVACRVEELAKVGDYMTYDILEESIIVVRSAPDKISAYYNVCQHRGRRLTQGSGRAVRFVCGFHGWAWSLDGRNTFVLDPEDWGKCLNPENLRLKEVKVDTWGGWVWINMDPNCQPLKDYLEPAVSMLAPVELEKMRYRWRRWLHVPCNWKTAMEAFNESYHVDATHPQLTRYGSTTWWSKAENHCGWHGSGTPRQGPGQKQLRGGGSGLGSIQATSDQDARIVAAEQHNNLMQTVDAVTTQTLVNAANRLVDELPPGTPADQVGAHLLASAIRDDAARGVIWPKLDPVAMAAMGHDWHVFPNTIILPGPTFALCYRARPNGYDPDSCIFEVYVLERFPPGQEPTTEWEHKPDPTEEKWLKILSQDFSNMPQVQKGMKSRGFAGARPNPAQEVAVIHFHRLLARYMDGVAAPRPLE